MQLYSIIWQKCTRTLWNGKQGSWCVNPDYLARALLEYAVAERDYFQETCFDDRWHQKYKIREKFPRLFVENRAARMIQIRFRSIEKRKRTASGILQLQWRKCMYDPEYSICRQRLKTEFDSFHASQIVITSITDPGQVRCCRSHLCHSQQIAR